MYVIPLSDEISTTVKVLAPISDFNSPRLFTQVLGIVDLQKKSLEKIGPLERRKRSTSGPIKKVIQLRTLIFSLS
jgi:hypothetical protein